MADDDTRCSLVNFCILTNGGTHPNDSGGCDYSNVRLLDSIRGKDLREGFACMRMHLAFSVSQALIRSDLPFCSGVFLADHSHTMMPCGMIQFSRSGPMEVSCPEEVFGIPGNSGVDWKRIVHNIRLGSYSRELGQASCARLACSLLPRCSLKCSPLLPYCSLCSPSPLPHVPDLKRPCSRSGPKTEADDPKFGVYIIYIYLFILVIPCKSFSKKKSQVKYSS